MRPINIKLLAYLLLVPVLFTFTSCDDDDDNDDMDTKKNIVLSFEHTFDGNAFTAGDTYDLNGRNLSVNRVNYYISNISLMDDAGTTIATFDDYLLVKQDQANTFTLGEVDAPHVHMIKFNVGIDSTTNHLDPSTYAATDALALQAPSMHWGWNPGYIFVALEGQLDTTATADGSLDDGFLYHIGLDKFYTPVTIMVHEDTHSGSTSTDFNIEISTDVAEFFKGLDLPAERQTKTMNNMPVAEKVGANFANAFSKK